MGESPASGRGRVWDLKAGKLRCFLFRVPSLRGAGSGGLLPVLRKTEGGRAEGEDGKRKYQEVHKTNH